MVHVLPQAAAALAVRREHGKLWMIPAFQKQSAETAAETCLAARVRVCVCARACVCVPVRVCVRARKHASVHACVAMCAHMHAYS